LILVMSETQRKHGHEPVGRAPAVAQPSACTGTRGKFFNDFSRARRRVCPRCAGRRRCQLQALF
jgi:hypothetical protein